VTLTMAATCFGKWGLVGVGSGAATSTCGPVLHACNVVTRTMQAKAAFIRLSTDGDLKRALCPGIAET
ncbi:MAG TPA: hypothetical protein VG815_20790, partial [Chloroflexota bacterium]|nr:hypothetical protein [Chloroflexota bacterium]